MGQNDDNAHPPITPAKAVNPETITDPTQRGVYSLVVKHYVSHHELVLFVTLYN